MVHLQPNERPILTVVVDTEEEFDWARPHARANTSVQAMAHIGRLQAVFDEARVAPCYVIDYPVASQREGYEPLLRIRERGGCEIGAHMHPWVNPPHEEEVTAFNSYPGNLAHELELAKLRALNARIERAFGNPATVYKAGRYGIGSNTWSVLEELAFDTDVSPLPAFDLSADGGPNFEDAPSRPWWTGREGRLLCIPITGALVGVLGQRAAACYRLATGPWPQQLRLPGVLARLRVLDRLRLSPEGYTLRELKRLTRFLYDRGNRVFSMSLHSPSVVPGCTPYVRTDQELGEFLARLAAYLAFFLEEMDGRVMIPTETREHLRAASESAA